MLPLPRQPGQPRRGSKDTSQRRGRSWQSSGSWGSSGGNAPQWGGGLICVSPASSLSKAPGRLSLACSSADVPPEGGWRPGAGPTETKTPGQHLCIIRSQLKASFKEHTLPGSRNVGDRPVLPSHRRSLTRWRPRSPPTDQIPAGSGHSLQGNQVCSPGRYLGR